MDRLNKQYKTQLETIVYSHTAKLLKGRLSVVFYDFTTLYFETSYEDNLRKLGFSKDGKTQNPQILLDFSVWKSGYPIGYEIFKSNKFERKTLHPTLEKYEKIFKINKPIVIADAGLLSKENIEQL